MDDLNQIPAFDCPRDRWDALGVALTPMRRAKHPRVLCLQHVGDAAHPFSSNGMLAQWVSGIEFDELRYHPLAKEFDGEPLETFLARAGEVITWNSNIGHDALIAGVPVRALGPASYAEVKGKDRERYFRRLAYAQWTVAEMRAGGPQRFLLDHWLPGTAPEVDDVRQREKLDVHAEREEGQRPQASAQVEAPPPVMQRPKPRRRSTAAHR